MNSEAIWGLLEKSFQLFLSPTFSRCLNSTEQFSPLTQCTSFCKNKGHTLSNYISTLPLFSLLPFLLPSLMTSLFSSPSPFIFFPSFLSSHLAFFSLMFSLTVKVVWGLHSLTQAQMKGQLTNWVGRGLSCSINKDRLFSVLKFTHQRIIIQKRVSHFILLFYKCSKANMCKTI